MTLLDNSRDPIARHPWLVSAIVYAAMQIHPKGAAISLIGFAFAVVMAAMVDHVLRRRH